MNTATDASIVLKKGPPLLPSLLRLLSLPRHGGDVPRLSLVQQSLSPNPTLLQRYRRLFNLHGQALPILYPHVMLGNHHLYLLGHPSFPYSLLGAVHTQNRIIQHVPIPAQAPLQIELTISGKRLGQGYLEFDLLTRAFYHEQLAWEELSVFKQRSKGISGHDPSPLSITSLERHEEIARWNIDGNLGRQYAVLCHDFNPIHLATPLAKIFGMPKAVAHGMAIVAQMTARLEGTIHPMPRTLDVIFKGPVPVGSTVRMVKSPDLPGRYDLYVDGNERPVICLHDH